MYDGANRAIGGIVLKVKKRQYEMKHKRLSDQIENVECYALANTTERRRDKKTRIQIDDSTRSVDKLLAENPTDLLIRTSTSDHVAASELCKLANNLTKSTCRR